MYRFAQENPPNVINDIWHDMCRPSSPVAFGNVLDKMIQIEVEAYEKERNLLPMRIRNEQEKITMKSFEAQRNNLVQYNCRNFDYAKIAEEISAIRAPRKRMIRKRLRLQIYRPILGDNQLTEHSNAFTETRIAVELLQRFDSEFNEMLSLAPAELKSLTESIRIEKERFIRRHLYELDIYANTAVDQSRVALKKLVYMVDNFGQAQYDRVRIVSNDEIM